MSRNIMFILLLAGLTFPLGAQTSYLDNEYYMSLADSCLKSTYGFHFQEAREYQQILQETTPGHPAPPFLEALILYWEHFPLLPDNELSEKFDALMDKSVNQAELLLDRPGTHLEGVFFDLFGRAFKTMFWADNGKATKAASDLRLMYKRTKEGFHMVEDLPGFYFSTGLYNYYIESYPEAHPLYKPLVAFMHKGDRDLGLRYLNLAIRESVFLRVEATLFMALIQANYENDLNTAALYAGKLIAEFPDNTYYQGLLISIWLHQHRYSQVQKLLPRLAGQSRPYSTMVRTLASAFLDEKLNGKDEEAGKAYQRTISQAEALGPIANMYNAIACMGLSRLHTKRGLHSAARRYARKAAKLTPYHFILEEL